MSLTYYGKLFAVLELMWCDHRQCRYFWYVPHWILAMGWGWLWGYSGGFRISRLFRALWSIYTRQLWLFDVYTPYFFDIFIAQGGYWLNYENEWYLQDIEYGIYENANEVICPMYLEYLYVWDGAQYYIDISLNQQDFTNTGQYFTFISWIMIFFYLTLGSASCRKLRCCRKRSSRKRSSRKRSRGKPSCGKPSRGKCSQKRFRGKLYPRKHHRAQCHCIAIPPRPVFFVKF